MRRSAVRSVRGTGTAQVESRKLCKTEAIAKEKTMAPISEANRHPIVLRGRLTVIDTAGDSTGSAREGGAISALVSSIEIATNLKLRKS